jgi:hypothetical protein
MTHVRQPLAVTGRLVASGGPPGATAQALSGTVTLENVTTHQRVTVHTATDGHYSISVGPGSYTARGSSPNYASGEANACSSYRTVVVTEATIIDVICEES